MSASTIIVIGVVVLVLLAAVALLTAARKRDTERATGYLSRETRQRDKGSPATPTDTEPLSGARYERAATSTALATRDTDLVKAGSGTLAPYVPPDPELLGVTRRQFFNRSIVALMGLSLSGFGVAVLGFLWPQVSGGFGSRISVGRLEDVFTNIDAGSGFYYVPEGRAWVTRYPVEAVDKAAAVYPPAVVEGMRAGVVALWQKCPHLGCRVPECVTSKWFECPCHGSQYNQAGEKKAGPAPRGMDRFGVSVSGGVVSIDTGIVYDGPAIGVNTTGQEAEGPHCIGGGH